MYKDVDGKHDDLDGQSSSLWTVAEAGKSILDFVNKTWLNSLSFHILSIPLFLFVLGHGQCPAISCPV